MGQRFMVTGGAGFIGSHSVECLLAAGHEVVVLDDLSTGKRGHLPDRVELRVGDIRDESLLEQLVPGLAGILHLAALVSVPRSVEAPLESLSRNVEGTLKVLEAARRHGVPRVVLASSAAVYGRTPPPLDEEAPVRPLSPYGLEKATCETYARIYHELHGLETVALRYFNVYGPRQDPSSPYSGVLSILADRARRGQPFQIHGDGLQTRDFVHVRDVAEANRLALVTRDLGHAVLNVGTGVPTSVRDLVQLVRTLVPDMPPPVHGPARAGDV
ncbi:MAG: NAD-dependent epimerase/dehydratase family protein, partial [Candidatus Sericytochromatia bacterium]|nr:NAD-dependent epimerase/dehydratase family protein [Candidatus Sericytochromatia bacterium]